MKIVRLQLEDASDFARICDLSKAGGALFYPTKIPLDRDEPVALDIRVPEISTAIVTRGRVIEMSSREDLRAAWLSMDGGALMAKDFLLHLARGAIGPWQNGRKHIRYPVITQVEWDIVGERESYVSVLGDLSWAGAFIRTLSLPSLGAKVRLQLRMPHSEPGILELTGRVNRLHLRGTAGMAVKFTNDGISRPILRRALRRMDLAGNLDFPN